MFNNVNKLNSESHLPKKLVLFSFSWFYRPLKIMNNVFCFILRALFVLKIFKFWSTFFGRVEERLDKKGKLNFKIYAVTNWDVNNYNKYFTRHLKK